jgi:CheY-like chemotaxis protein
VRVLVVDDHRNTRLALAASLDALGFHADVADGQGEAVARLQEAHYDWVVCDVRMPDGDGLAVAGVARTGGGHTGVILMTACDLSPLEHARAEALGVQLLIKPVTGESVARLCHAELAQEQSSFVFHRRSLV